MKKNLFLFAGMILLFSCQSGKSDKSDPTDIVKKYTEAVEEMDFDKI
jgi:hypothetical protein